jgi:hypothetical protein
MDTLELETFTAALSVLFFFPSEFGWLEDV